jgi:hypothetical protein
MVKKCSSTSTKGSLVFSSINLLIELFINCSEPKDRDSIGITASGSMKVTWCSEAKSISAYDLQKGPLPPKICRDD